MNIRSATWRALGTLLLAGSAAAAAPAPETVDDTLDWAEWAYPGTFANGSMSGPVTFQGRSYRARHYDGPWGTRWLGADDDGQVWGLGDFTGWAPQSLGALEKFSARVAGSTCSVYPLDPVCADPLPQRRLALGLFEVAASVGTQRQVRVWSMSGSPAQLINTGAQASSVLASWRGASLSLGTADGKVSGWGWLDFDADGQVFDPNVGRPAAVPKYEQAQPIYFPSRIIQAGWSYHGPVALRADGSLWLRPGRLVDAGAGMKRVSAVRAQGLPPLRALARGESWMQHVLAIDRDDGVWQVTVIGRGNGWDLQPFTFARRLPGLPPLRDAVCAGPNCLALARDGRVWAWGDNTAGQLGQGQSAPVMRADPQAVPGLADIVDIAITGRAMLALGADGRVWSWGQGALGSGATGAVASPAVVAGIDQVAEIVGAVAENTAVLARRRDGTLWAWGRHAMLNLTPTPGRLLLPGLEVVE